MIIKTWKVSHPPGNSFTEFAEEHEVMAKEYAIQKNSIAVFTEKEIPEYIEGQ